MKTEININNLDEELDETLYIVYWHMGGLAITPEDIGGNNYCEQCGDIDMSDDGSNTFGELILALIDGFTHGYDFDENDFSRLKETLSDGGFDLNMTLSEVNAYIQEES